MALTHATDIYINKRHIGAFSVGIDCTEVGDELAQQVKLLYGDYPPMNSADFPDLVVCPKQLRRWLPFGVRKVEFCVGGSFPFTPMSANNSLPMIEIGLNWLITRSATRLLFHAAVVARAGKAILLPGPSGAGKSTLSASLMAQGWQLLSDEFAILAPEDNRMLPHPRPISLKEESIDIVARILPDAYFSNRIAGTEKGEIAYLKPSQESIDNANRSALPVAIIFPRYAPNGDHVMDPVAKADAFMRLVDHSANYFTMMEASFEALSWMVNACPIYDFTYRNLDQAISDISEIHERL